MLEIKKELLRTNYLKEKKCKLCSLFVLFAAVHLLLYAVITAMLSDIVMLNARRKIGFLTRKFAIFSKSVSLAGSPHTHPQEVWVLE